MSKYGLAESVWRYLPFGQSGRENRRNGQPTRRRHPPPDYGHVLILGASIL